MSKKVIVIGAGIAGLATGIRLRVLGYDVSVFEANSYAGGKLTEVKTGDYRFDAGPSLFTMPQYIDELFELAGKDPRDYYDYKRLDVLCRYHWDDGTALTTYADPQQTAQEMATVLGEAPETILSHLADSRAKYELTGRTFLEYSLHKLKSWLHPSTITAMCSLHKLDLMRSMHAVNASRFENEKTVQLFDRYATYNGSNPYKTPGLLNIIPHYEYGFGAYYPRGGMHSITKAVVRLAEELGVEFRYGTKVTTIAADAAIQGIVADGQTYKADIVVSNMDVYYTYKHLLGHEAKAQKIKKQERSSSALIFYWGVARRFPSLDLHNIFFSDDYKAEFDAIARGEVYEDPTVYVNISAKETSTDAPTGCENWFTMINVPYDAGQDWDDIAGKAKRNILAKLSSRLGVSMSDLIVEETVLDPVLIDKKTSSHTGSLYGTSSNSKWAAFMRHPNFTSQVSGLYFCGGSVHPGGGIPLCLLSAKIVYDLIRTKYQQQ